MSQICSFRNCKNESYKHHQECVLHCTKNTYSERDWDWDWDWDDDTTFCSALVDFIISNSRDLQNALNSDGFYNLDELTQFLKDDLYRSTALGLCEDTRIQIFGVKFPHNYDSDPKLDFTNILTKFKSIRFNVCEFSSPSLDLKDTPHFYQKCTFFDEWTIGEPKIQEKVNGVLFCECEFNKDVLGLHDNSGGYEYVVEFSLFKDCVFKSKISLENINFSRPIFKNTKNKNFELNNFDISRCTVQDKFILNKLKAKSLKIEDTEFLSKLELKHGDIDKVKIINSNFKGLFDAYCTQFDQFSASKSIFSDFVGFEKCKFGKPSDEKNVAQFEYVTFLSFTNFRNTVFHQGLNLEDTNLKEAPNFLNVKFEDGIKNTDRETFRIIKNSFDKIGNHIEANKFFAYEMDRHQQDLKDESISQEKIIFWLNKYSSNFGQSYLLPIFWLFMSWAVYALITAQWATNLLIEHFPKVYGLIAWINDFFNDFFKNAIPFNKLLVKDLEFISLIFYVICASLLWQTIVALKRHTQR